MLRCSPARVARQRTSTLKPSDLRSLFPLFLPSFLVPSTPFLPTPSRALATAPLSLRFFAPASLGRYKPPFCANSRGFPNFHAPPKPALSRGGAVRTGRQLLFLSLSFLHSYTPSLLFLLSLISCLSFLFPLSAL